MTLRQAAGWLYVLLLLVAVMVLAALLAGG
jgi:hypothetical protein